MNISQLLKKTVSTRSKSRTERDERVRLAKKAGFKKGGKWWLKPGIDSGLHAALGDWCVNPDDYPDTVPQPLPTRDELRVYLLNNHHRLKLND